MPNDVTARHPDYDAALPRWNKAEDAAAGEDAVKAKGDVYLPKPNPKDTSTANQQRFEQYLARAVYYNATGRTLKGLLGLAFDKDPELKLPAQIDAAREDVTGSGVTLFQHMQGTLTGVLKCGRAGLLADFPSVNGPVSKQDEMTGGVRPTLTYYPATAVTNWRTARVAGKTVLALVVLLETHETADGFATKREPQYRVLRLDGIYMVELWRKMKDATGKEDWRIAEQYAPLQANGTAWTEIPFQFVGAETNDSSIDDAPLYDIATLNLAHYRNSADYEDSAYFCGQPQVYMAGLDENWVKMLEEKGIYFGSRAILPLPVNGQAGILQAEPNTLAKEAMDGKERQMAALGARLIQAGSAPKTATQQDSEDTVAHSVLSLCAENVSAAYRQAMTWYATFAGAEGDIETTLSNDFTRSLIDAQMLTALVQAVQGGQLPLSVFWARLRAAGVIDAQKTDAQLRGEIASEGPTSGDLTDGGDSSQQAA